MRRVMPMFCSRWRALPDSPTLYRADPRQQQSRHDDGDQQKSPEGAPLQNEIADLAEDQQTRHEEDDDYPDAHSIPPAKVKPNTRGVGAARKYVCAEYEPVIVCYEPSPADI
jgi:hypothetical protein